MRSILKVKDKHFNLGIYWERNTERDRISSYGSGMQVLGSSTIIYLHFRPQNPFGVVSIRIRTSRMLEIHENLLISHVVIIVESSLNEN